MKKHLEKFSLLLAATYLGMWGIAHASANAKLTPQCIPLPENGFFSELMGITFSPEQAAAYDILEKQVSKMAEERFKDVESRELSGSPPNVEMKPGAFDEVAGQIMAAQDQMIAQGVSPREQIKRLTEQFGAYAEFKMPRGAIFTDEQLVRKEQFRRETEQMFRNMLTPEQQRTYNSNLARRAEIEACEEKPEEFLTV